MHKKLIWRCISHTFCHSARWQRFSALYRIWRAHLQIFSAPLWKGALQIRKRALQIRKRALQIYKRALILRLVLLGAFIDSLDTRPRKKNSNLKIVAMEHLCNLKDISWPSFENMFKLTSLQRSCSEAIFKFEWPPFENMFRFQIIWNHVQFSTRSKTCSIFQTSKGTHQIEEQIKTEGALHLNNTSYRALETRKTNTRKFNPKEP